VGVKGFGGAGSTKFLTGFLSWDPSLVFWISSRHRLGLVGQPGSSAARNTSSKQGRRRGMSVGKPK
jgi:hypothetical protein